MDISLILQSVVSGLLMGGLLSLVAIGLSLIFGVMNIINFAHGSLMMLGMYIAYFLFRFLHLDPYLSIVVTIPTLFLVGMLIQKVLINPVLDAPHINQLILTMGLMLFMDNCAALVFGNADYSINVGYTSSAIHFMGISVSITRLLASCFSLGMNLILYIFLKKADLGKAIRAASQEPRAAQLVGIDVKRIYLLAFGIGAACVGAAGSVVMSFYPVSPHVGGTFLIASFVIVMMGGGSNLMGVFWAAIILGLVESLSQVILMLPASLAQVVSFGMLIIILFFKPTGLFGSVTR